MTNAAQKVFIDIDIMLLLGAEISLLPQIDIANMAFIFGFNVWIHLLEFADECVTAAEVYSCGKQKEPTIVNAIFTESTGNGTYVREQKNSMVMKLS
jgi:hypothetical protein